MGYWTVPEMWPDGECWIIGGGFSIPRQFGVPDNIIQDVMKGVKDPSAYSQYMEAIHEKHTIGINMAYKIGDWIDIIFFGDKSFYDKVKYDFMRVSALKVTCQSTFNSPRKFPGVKIMRRLPRKKLEGISNMPNAVCWNYNSGAAAISVAAHTGVKRIVLLGFDMNLGEGEHRHWHYLYGKKSKPPPYPNHIRCFPAIKHDAKKRGIEIINANPDSAIKEFPRMSVKELL